MRAMVLNKLRERLDQRRDHQTVPIGQNLIVFMRVHPFFPNCEKLFPNALHYREFSGFFLPNIL